MRSLMPYSKAKEIAKESKNYQRGSVTANELATSSWSYEWLDFHNTRPNSLYFSSRHNF